MRRALIVACAALAVVPVAGCGSKKAPTGAPPAGASTGASDTASGGGAAASGDATLTYLDSNELMVGWDPATAYSNEVSVMNNMYEQLVRYDKKTQKIVPQLAESYTSSGGGKTWTFKLRSGVKFHTGRPVTAAAAKAAIKRTMKLNQGAAYEWAPVKSIETPDDQTLVFHLSYAAPLDTIASSAYAAYIYDTKAAPGSKLAGWFAEGHEAGTGPYELEQWNKGEDIEVRLKRFGDYWGGWDGAHYAHVVFRHVPQATTSAQLLRTGDATIARQLNPQLFASVKSAQGMTSSTTPSFENLVGLLNTKSGPLQDKRVRQAVIDAFDYKGLISALKGAGVASHGVIPEGLAGYDPSIVQEQKLDEAKALLKQAGYGPGAKKLTLTLTMAQGDDNESLTASILKSDLAQLNIDLQVSALQWTAQWNKAKSSDVAGRQDIFVMYWFPDYADPFSWFTQLFHSSPKPYFNLSYAKDPVLDQQIDGLQEEAAKGAEQADAAYQAAQRTVVNDALTMTFFVATYQRAYRSSMTGYVDNPAYSNVVFAYDVTPGAGS